MGSYLIANRTEVEIAPYLRAAGFLEQSTRVYESPLAGAVHIVEARWEGQLDVPHGVRLGPALYARILDRVFLPLPPDPIVATALFDTVAVDYETMVDTCRNYANIERLVGVVLRFHQGCAQVLRILDFGCGTGLSALVLAQHALSGQSALCNAHIVGSDASAAMLSLARRRGLAVVSYEEWRHQPERSYDGMIASYVLHCGVTDDEWSVLAQQMTSTAVFAANYHHADEPSLDRVMAQASRVGLAGEIIDVESPPWVRDPVLVFRHK